MRMTVQEKSKKDYERRKRTSKSYISVFYKTKDKELIKKLESVPSKSGYIKSLIWKDMEKAKEAGEWW